MLDLQPKHFKIILWDMDGTILDFYPAERNAICSTMEHFGLGECTEEMIKRYSKINEIHWKRMERGEITKQQVLEDRFAVFFKGEGINFTKYKEFNELYQQNLGAKVFFHEQAYEIVANLKGKVLQYAITNGTSTAQTLKLKNSGLDKLFDGVFISDQIGYEKPSKLFFDYVEAQIPKVPKDEILVVGDSLTSDMQGGNNMGVRCCWFNYDNKPLPENDTVKLDYVIHKLIELEKIL